MFEFGFQKIVLLHAHKWLTSDFSLKSNFSLEMRSPRGPGMVNGLELPQNAMKHGDSCVVNFWSVNKNKKKKKTLTGVRSRFRKSLAKRLI